MMNGCMNRPDQTSESGHWAQDGWIYDSAFGIPSRKPRMVWVKHAMSRECEYSKTTADPGCDGCASKRGVS